MTTFDAARAIVTNSSAVRRRYRTGAGFNVADYGWENDTEYLITAGTDVDFADDPDPTRITLDAPIIYVSKQDGTIRLAFGLRVDGIDPTAGMTPIGDVPDMATAGDE